MNPTPTRRRIPPLLGAHQGRPASPLLLYIRGRGAPKDTQVDCSKPCVVPPSTIIHLDHIVAVFRRSPASVATSSPSWSPRHCADGTLLRSSAGSEFVGRHRAERVLNSEVSCVRYLDRSDHEDVRLHQPRFHNASAYGLRGYVDDTLPSRCYAYPR